jgi:lambda repressor-like predicted transcriptional regulator
MKHKVIKPSDVRRQIRKRKKPIPRTADAFFTQSDADQETWKRVLRTIAKMRTDGLSLTKAAKEAGVSPKKVTSWGGRALRKGKNGRYMVAKRDSLLRVVQVPTSHGSREIALRNSRHASTLGQYWDAVHKYLRTGDTAGIEKFRGKRIKDANGNQVQLITNFAKLNRLGSAGVLSFESLYARAA